MKLLNEVADLPYGHEMVRLWVAVPSQYVHALKRRALRLVVNGPVEPKHALGVIVDDAMLAERQKDAPNA